MKPKLSRGPQRVATPHVTEAEDVSLYRWFCRTCKYAGTLPSVPGETADSLTRRARQGHSRKAPGCLWSDEDVTICRINP